ncbi:hypothetical protein HHK36_031666 [Tetracentron sinense]|uniref:Uncharacterized protein n=1 Tax=Tetracentron sinense TaxID=13715 RepID=A0A834YAQ5_TETSI|nr:hypothetical protein HHK36_031666 [Tetracentron sinense]
MISWCEDRVEADQHLGNTGSVAHCIFSRLSLSLFCLCIRIHCSDKGLVFNEKFAEGLKLLHQSSAPRIIDASKGLKFEAPLPFPLQNRQALQNDIVFRPSKLQKAHIAVGFGRKALFGSRIFGRLGYNSHRMDEFVPQRTSTYISQIGLHTGEMTVRETLAFSTRWEMLVGPEKTLFMYEISTCLDSSTTIQIVNSLNGHIMYQGPVNMWLSSSNLCASNVLRGKELLTYCKRQVLLQHEPGWASGILWKKEKYEGDQVVLVANSLPALELPEIVVEAVKDCVKAQ